MAREYAARGRLFASLACSIDFILCTDSGDCEERCYCGGRTGCSPRPSPEAQGRATPVAATIAPGAGTCHGGVCRTGCSPRPSLKAQGRATPVAATIAPGGFWSTNCCFSSLGLTLVGRGHQVKGGVFWSTNVRFSNSWVLGRARRGLWGFGMARESAARGRLFASLACSIDFILCTDSGDFEERCYCGGRTGCSPRPSPEAQGRATPVAATIAPGAGTCHPCRSHYRPRGRDVPRWVGCAGRAVHHALR